MPIFLAHNGKLVLHAASVVLNEKCVAIAGDSGSGKSTIAARFAIEEAGMLGDDGLIVLFDESHPKVAATYTGVRLRQNSARFYFPDRFDGECFGNPNTKVFIAEKNSSAQHADPLALASVIFLSQQDRIAKEISVRQISPRESCMRILRSAFQGDVSDAKSVSHMFAQTAAVASVVPCFELVYPHRFDVLDEVTDCIRTIAGLKNELASTPTRTGLLRAEK